MKLLEIPEDILNLAIEAKNENFNILDPKIYTKHKIADNEFLESVKDFIQSDLPMDIVLFSSKSGALPHIDTHLDHLDDYTYIIPLILPTDGYATIKHSEGESVLEYAVPILISHQHMHSLEVSNESGCVVLMASKILKK
jgi:hypothetical protein